MKYALIGCGLIGKKRALALKNPKDLIVACDLDESKAHEITSALKQGKIETNFRKAIAHNEVEAVIVSTRNHTLSEVSLAAIQAGKHVLVEKPAAISIAQIQPLIENSKKQNIKIRIGFNHRFHPAFIQARNLFEKGCLGELMFIRARYGHGGRLGYDQEWRANPQLSGGGELIDQGVHLIDLAQWFLGDFTTVKGHVSTCYWNMPVDDNAFLSLRTSQGQTAWLHASCTEWKNLFSFEIYGKNAKLHIEGLGGSYGIERLYFYKMLPEMGPPETMVWEYPKQDTSWQLELEAFEKDVLENRQPNPSLQEAQQVLQIVEKIYYDNGYCFTHS